MTMYESSRTLTPGMFIRNRTNAISVRSRRRTKPSSGSNHLDQNENEIENSSEVTKPNMRIFSRRSRYSNEFDNSANLHSKSEEILSSDVSRRERAYSNDNARNSCSDDELDLVNFRPVSRRDFERKSEVFTSRSRSRAGAGFRSGPMETLDRRISASTDNLDTLKREKRSNRMWNENLGKKSEKDPLLRPRSVSGRQPKDKNTTPADDDFTFRINGEKMSKNRYFFGGELKSALKNGSKKSGAAVSSDSGNGKSQQGVKMTNGNLASKNSRKTALDIFLEDKGPYSRKLYGPPPSSDQIIDNFPADSKHNRKRARSQEALLYEVSTSSYLSRAKDRPLE